MVPAGGTPQVQPEGLPFRSLPPTTLGATSPHLHVQGKQLKQERPVSGQSHRQRILSSQAWVGGLPHPATARDVGPGPTPASFPVPETRGSICHLAQIPGVPPVSVSPGEDNHGS